MNGELSPAPSREIIIPPPLRHPWPLHFVIPAKAGIHRWRIGCGVRLRKFSISVTLESENEPKIEYALEIGKEGNFAIITNEQLDVHSDSQDPTPLAVISRTRNRCRIA
jgi:hypothetical protein